MNLKFIALIAEERPMNTNLMNTNTNRYKPKTFDLHGLEGISDNTIDLHLSLYEGYVKNTNLLSLELTKLAMKNSASASNPVYAALKRRFGFEYNGMVLHEHYFGSLIPAGKAAPSEPLLKTLCESFGSLEGWRNDFDALANVRGIGWTVLFQDPADGRLTNQWIELHHQSVPVGLKPLLVLDLWEHAYLLDYKPADRSEYVEAFFANINWDTINLRFDDDA
jgi:Fe-Mn family superoxide dismutase